MLEFGRVCFEFFVLCISYLWKIIKTISFKFLKKIALNIDEKKRDEKEEDTNAPKPYCSIPGPKACPIFE